MFNAERAADLAEQAKRSAGADATAIALAAVAFALLDNADARREATALSERMANTTEGASEDMRRLAHGMLKDMGVDLEGPEE